MTSPKSGNSTDTVFGRNARNLGDSLAVVSLLEEQLTESLGSLLNGGPAFVVGSLPAGYGNAGSDVDINVFLDDDIASSVPMMFFVDDVIVDIQYFRRSEPRDVAKALRLDVTPLGEGLINLHAAPPPKIQKRLGRWLTAVQLTERDRPSQLLGDAVVPVPATLVRGALEELARQIAVASILECTRSTATPLGWNRAARAAVELWARLAGELFVGDKWTAAKSRLIDPTERSWETINSEQGLDDLLAHLRLATKQPLTTAALRNCVQSVLIAGDCIQIGHADYRLVNDRLLRVGSVQTSCAVADVTTTEFEEFAYGARTLAIDHGALSRLLGSSAPFTRHSEPADEVRWVAPVLRQPEASRDARWLATHGTAAAWARAMLVEAGLEDIEAAINAGDWSTTIEAASLTLLRIGYCEMVLSGVAGGTSESELVLANALWMPTITERVAGLPGALSATESDATNARQVVREAESGLAERLPFQIKAMRTPTGFFPAVRTAAGLERLRASIGLGGFAWEHWGV